MYHKKKQKQTPVHEQMLKQKWTLQQRQTMPKLQSCGCKGRNPNEISISFWSTHCASKVPIKGHCPSDLVYSLSWWASNTNTGASLCIWTPISTISAAALWCMASPADYVHLYIYTYIHIYIPPPPLFIHQRNEGDWILLVIVSRNVCCSLGPQIDSAEFS